MFCSSCGKELHETNVFCPTCGTKVKRSESQDEVKKTVNRLERNDFHSLLAILKQVGRKKGGSIFVLPPEAKLQKGNLFRTRILMKLLR